MEEKKEEKEEEKKEEKKHRCAVCGRPSDTVICHACEDRVRAEALEKKHDIEKGGRK
jgi:ribosomal protein S14